MRRRIAHWLRQLAERIDPLWDKELMDIIKDIDPADTPFMRMKK